MVDTRHVAGGVGVLAFTSSTFQYLCKTPAYVAGTGERAVIMVRGSTMGVPVGSGLGVRPGYNVNGGTDTTIGLWHYQKNNGNGVTNLSNGMDGTLSLTAGSTYVFSTAMNDSEGAGYSASTFCNTVVMFVKI